MTIRSPFARSDLLALLSVAGSLLACSRPSSSESRGETYTRAERGGGSAARTSGDPIASDTVEAPAIQLIGRFDTRDTSGPKCSWPGCRIVARFEGPSASVRVRLDEIDEPWMEGGPSEWDVAIDGAWQPKLVTTKGQASYALASGLGPGPHSVELYKRSEAQTGSTRFLGFDFAGGTLLAPPPRKSRRIEIIGDSAAAAFGVEGDGPKCPGLDYAAKWQNFRESFGARLGEIFDAEVMGTVYSGKGLVKNIWHPDKETMPIIYPRANPIDSESRWEFTQYVPDVVIIMIGGNDFAIGQPVDEGPASLDEFAGAYEAFVAVVRSKYDRAEIFLVISPSVSDAQPEGRHARTNVKAGVARVIAARRDEDARLHALEPPVAQPEELTGCNGHGNPAYHRRIANDLAPPVRSKTGW